MKIVFALLALVLLAGSALAGPHVGGTFTGNRGTFHGYHNYNYGLNSFNSFGYGLNYGYSYAQPVIIEQAPIVFQAPCQTIVQQAPIVQTYSAPVIQQAPVYAPSYGVGGCALGTYLQSYNYSPAFRGVGRGGYGR